ncbi:MAG: sigma-54-dependent transcriptional regulator [Syntrophothermus sp.]
MYPNTTQRSATVLFVDDEGALAGLVSRVLNADGHEVLTADTCSQALQKMVEIQPEVVLLDLRMPDMDGLACLEMIKAQNAGIAVVIITAYGSIEKAVEAMKKGADDFLTKPFTTEQLRMVVKKVLVKQRLAEENQYLRAELRNRHGLGSLIGKSKKMQELFTLIHRAAGSNARVLILGESGTGKELVAGAIHHNSSRQNNAFVQVSCAAIPETLLESELFGYEKGAFTGAISRKLGRFELADGGTLFLDEVGEMSLATQVKLLRVLQEGDFQRLGGNKTIRVDVRIIAATNRDLQRAMSGGSFREDLFYRLNVLPIQVPPLRERREDIPLLVSHFLDNGRRDGAPPPQVSQAAMAMLMDYHWPGNVRELENVIERALVLGGGGTIEPQHLPPEILNHGEKGNRVVLAVGISLREAEREMIVKTLDYTRGNRAKAAGILGISLRALQYKLKDFGLNPRQKD